MTSFLQCQINNLVVLIQYDLECYVQETVKRAANDRACLDLFQRNQVQP